MALISPFDHHDLHEQSQLEANKLIRGSYDDVPIKLRRALCDDDEPPTIPPESVFTSLYEDPTPSPQLPSVAQCAVHLELLEAFMILREKVMKSRTFRARPPKFIKDISWIEQENWKSFVRLAVIRFKIWFALMYGEFHSDPVSSNQRLLVSDLPPLDVLMVLHAFMLNPTDYEEVCERFVKDSHGDIAQVIEFPWDRLHHAIDSDSRKYDSVVKLKADTSKDSDLEHVHAEDPGLKYVRDHLHQDLLEFLASLNSKSILLNVLSGRTNSEGVQAADIVKLEDKAEASLTMAYCGLATLDTRLEGFDFAEAVHRQSKFVDKMCHMLWIRSPALVSTLEQAGKRYENFFSLFSWYPNRLIVPTLDVDLVWHTHLLSPAKYRQYCMERTGRVIDHNDKIKPGVLNDSFREARSLYRLRFLEDYLLCHCWLCEAIRAAIANANDKSKIPLQAMMYDVQMQVAYHRAFEIARRRRNGRLPVGNRSRS